MNKARMRAARRRSDGRKTLVVGENRLVPMQHGWFYRVTAGGRGWTLQHMYETHRGYNVMAYSDASYLLFATRLDPASAAKYAALHIEEALAKHGRGLSFKEALANIGTIRGRRNRS